MWIKGEVTEKNLRVGRGDSYRAQEYPLLRLFPLLFFFLSSVSSPPVICTQNPDTGRKNSLLVRSSTPFPFSTTKDISQY